MIDEITVMFQDTGRRHDDKPGAGESRKARLVWDEPTRKVFASVIAEAVAHTVQKMVDTLGVDAHTHSEQHRAMNVLIPWVEAQKRKAEKQTEFWETLLKENVKRGIGWAFWLLVTAMVLGFSGAWDGLLHRITGGG